MILHALIDGWPRKFLIKLWEINNHVLNVLVEWLKLLLCILEVPGSDLGPETGYPVVFLSLSRQMLG
jgi:hypothetical protein